MTQFKQFGIKPIPHIESVFDGGENIYKLLCFSFDMDKLKQAKEELKHHKKLAQTSSGKHIRQIVWTIADRIDILCFNSVYVRQLC